MVAECLHKGHCPLVYCCTLSLTEVQISSGLSGRLTNCPRTHHAGTWFNNSWNSARNWIYLNQNPIVVCFGLFLEVFLDGQISSYIVKVADCGKFESLCQTFEPARRMLNLTEIQTEASE